MFQVINKIRPKLIHCSPARCPSTWSCFPNWRARAIWSRLCSSLGAEQMLSRSQMVRSLTTRLAKRSRAGTLDVRLRVTPWAGADLLFWKQPFPCSFCRLSRCGGRAVRSAICLSSSVLLHTFCSFRPQRFLESASFVLALGCSHQVRFA